MPLPRLLAIGEGLSPTGYARVMESVLEPLSRAFDVTLFAINHRGPVGSHAFSFAVRGNELPGDRYGYDQLAVLLAELDPDVVLLHGNSDFHLMHRSTLAGYRARRPDARVVVYCPADWPEQPPGVVEALATVDLLVMYTGHGLGTVQRAFRASGLRVPPVAVIPHGVDCSRFAPMSRSEARRRLFPGEPGLAAAFIVLNANRNQHRKRVDLTLRGFAAFAQDRPDARLYLHMGMRDMGCDVVRLAAELGIADRLLTTSRSDGHPHVSDEHLNLIYNACDVGVNTASAEGWGLVSFEHAAAGAPQVVPSGGACARLWEGTGIVAEPSRVDEALVTLYSDAALRAELGGRCRALARSPRFSWGEIAARWEELLKACMRDGTRGTQDSNLESPVLETGALAS